MPSGREGLEGRARDAQEIIRRDGEDVPWGSGCRPDQREIGKPGIGPDRQGGEVAHGGDAADGKARDGADAVDPGAGEGFARKGRSATGVDLIAARGEKEAEPSGCRAFEKDRFHDLVEMDPCRLGGLLSRAGFARHLERRDVEACCVKGGGDAGEAFAHLRVLCGGPSV